MPISTSMKKSHGFLHEAARHLEAAFGHLEHLIEHEVQSCFAEVRDVEDVLPLPPSLHLDLEPWG